MTPEEENRLLIDIGIVKNSCEQFFKYDWPEFKKKAEEHRETSELRDQTQDGFILQNTSDIRWIKNIGKGILYTIFGGGGLVGLGFLIASMI